MKLLNLLYNPIVRRYISQNRNGRLVRWINEFSMLYHRVYENHNYNFSENGEFFVLDKIRNVTSLKTIFDVGANVGDWAKVSNSLFPQAKIYSFEILSTIFPLLETNLKPFPNIRTFNIGLSDVEENTFVYYVEKNSALSTCMDNFSEDFHHINSSREACQTITGDLFCERNMIHIIDFLKIDVEGLEGKVLRGFEKMLSKNCIKIIQFEYGYTSLSSGFYLKDFYTLFRKYNMIVGKIYPNYVDFTPYNYMKEDFIGPNYIAISDTEDELINSLKSK